MVGEQRKVRRTDGCSRESCQRRAVEDALSIRRYRLLDREPSVLSLFARDPFDGKAPTEVRVVLWQYWFTDAARRRATGAWWTRQELGPYCPTLARSADGAIDLAP